MPLRQCGCSDQDGSYHLVRGLMAGDALLLASCGCGEAREKRPGSWRPWSLRRGGTGQSMGGGEDKAGCREAEKNSRSNPGNDGALEG